MSFPIRTANPLVVKKRILCVRASWKTEFHSKVGSDPNDQDALTPLWNAEIGGIQTLIDYVVT